MSYDHANVTRDHVYISWFRTGRNWIKSEEHSKWKKKTETEGKSKLRWALMPSSTVYSGPHDLLVVRTVSKLIKWLAMRKLALPCVWCDATQSQKPSGTFWARECSHRKYKQRANDRPASVSPFCRSGNEDMRQRRSTVLVSYDVLTAG